VAKADIEDDDEPEEEKDLPVHKDLRKGMLAELVVNEKGEVWILHDKQLPGILLWVEFDTIDDSITLCMEDGKIQKLGITVNRQMRKSVMKARKVYTMLTDGKAIKDMYLVPIVVRKV
jgi:VCBS repeat-containing protein